MERRGLLTTDSRARRVQSVLLGWMRFLSRWTRRGAELRAFCLLLHPDAASFELAITAGRDRTAAVESLPPVMLEMHRRKMKRESIIVNSFAYLGLALGLAIFLALVAVNVLLLEKALWFFLLASAIFLVGSRLLAGVFGGIIGDEIGFRYANKRLSEDWAAHVHEREQGNTGGAATAT